jgi:hypothetical protein
MEEDTRNIRRKKRAAGTLGYRPAGLIRRHTEAVFFWSFLFLSLFCHAMDHGLVGLLLTYKLQVRHSLHCMVT